MLPAAMSGDPTKRRAGATVRNVAIIGPRKKIKLIRVLRPNQSRVLTAFWAKIAPQVGRACAQGYCSRCTVTPPHCFSPIAAQDATVWSKLRSTLPLVVKLFITNFEQLALLLDVLPSVTTLELPR